MGEMAWSGAIFEFDASRFMLLTAGEFGATGNDPSVLGRSKNPTSRIVLLILVDLAAANSLLSEFARATMDWLTAASRARNGRATFAVVLGTTVSTIPS